MTCVGASQPQLRSLGAPPADCRQATPSSSSVLSLAFMKLADARKACMQVVHVQPTAASSPACFRRKNSSRRHCTQRCQASGPQATSLHTGRGSGSSRARAHRNSLRMLNSCRPLTAKTAATARGQCHKRASASWCSGSSSQAGCSTMSASRQWQTSTAVCSFRQSTLIETGIRCALPLLSVTQCHGTSSADSDMAQS